MDDARPRLAFERHASISAAAALGGRRLAKDAHADAPQSRARRLVSRRAYATVPPRVEYSLTPLGRTLIEPLYVLAAWAEEETCMVHASRL